MSLTFVLRLAVLDKERGRRRRRHFAYACEQLLAARGRIEVLGVSKTGLVVRGTNGVDGRKARWKGGTSRPFGALSTRRPLMLILSRTRTDHAAAAVLIATKFSFHEIQSGKSRDSTSGVVPSSARDTLDRVWLVKTTPVRQYEGRAAVV